MAKGKSVVIVESPAKAKTINKVLGSNYIVKASMGHVRDLPKNKIGINLEEKGGFEPDYITIRGRGKTIGELKKAVASAEKVYLASDLDREGEAIAWHLVEALSIPEDKAIRVTFNAITKKAIEEAFDNPGKISMDKVYAQQARRVLDRIVGYKLSPLLWDKIAKGLSAGRVQSVAVKLIVEREKEIRAFVSEEYWKITATLHQKGTDGTEEEIFKAELKRIDNKPVKPTNEEEAMGFFNDIKEKPFVVDEITRQNKTERPLPPFNTSQLQQQASVKLRFSAKKTMMVAQQLYEGIELGAEGATGLITYMRTDSLNIDPEAVKEVRGVILDAFGEKYLPEKPSIYKAKKRSQEAHEAVRPTSALRSPTDIQKHLTHDQFRLYNLIWERFVASQMMPARFALTNVKIKAGRGTFTTSGKELLFDGHTKVFRRERPSDEQALPSLTEQEVLQLKELLPTQHFTKPPNRFSEATLVKALEKEGIGRPSTYAPIISTIQDRGYVLQRSRKFFATELGIVVTDKLQEHFPEILKVDFTSKLEDNLDKVEDATADWVNVVGSFYKIFDEDLAKAYENMQDIKRNPEKSEENCDKCKKPFVIRYNKNGKFLACSGYPDCKNTRAISEYGEEEAEDGEELTCDQCGSNMALKQGSRGKFYACTGYPDCKNTRSIGSDGPKEPPKETDHKCPLCDSMLYLRTGKRGKFLACSAFPKCRHTYAVDEKDQPLLPEKGHEKCDKCGKPMTVKVGRRGRFVACTGYPKCRNTMSLGKDSKDDPKKTDAEPEDPSAKTPEPAS